MGKRDLSEKIKSFNIDPTSRCNLKCPFCWGAPRGNYNGKKDRDMTLKEFEKILTFMKNEFESDFVMFNGGEPLIRKDIVQFMKKAKQLKYGINLSTNATLLKQQTEVLDYLTSISIPIDSINEEITGKLRPPMSTQHEYAFDTLSLLNTNHPNIHIKLGTIVSGINYQEILPIGEEVRRRGLFPDTWKLYQYKNVGNQRNNPLRKKLMISDEKFKSIVAEVEDEFGEWTVANLANNTKGLYLLIRPDGSLTTEQDEEGNTEPDLCNLLTDSHDKIVGAINSVVDREGSLYKIRETYGV